MGTLASGSIDLKSLKVAGEPNKYITYIDATNGIRVHEAGAENTNFIQINSTGMSIYTGGQAESNKIAEFKSYITLGTRAISSIIGSNSIAMGTNVAATGISSMATGHSTTASGNYSHAEGWGTTASGNYSHAEGSSGQLDNEDLIASGAFSHAEGFSTQAAGRASHAGGQYSIAANDYSLAHGLHVTTAAQGQIVFGKYNQTDSNAMFVIGNGTEATRSNLMVIGDNDIRIGNTDSSRIQMDYRSLRLIDKEGKAYLYISDLRDSDGNMHNTFSGDGATTTFILPYYVSNYINPYEFYVKVDGNTISTSDYDILTDSTNLTHSIVFQNAPASDSEIEIIYTNANYKFKSYTLGYRKVDKSIGKLSVAEGDNITANGDTSHAEGNSTTASGASSHAEGYNTTASGYASHAEGIATTASKACAHTEGNNTVASGNYSHAEGDSTVASRICAHAEGNGAIASGMASHAEGGNTEAYGTYSHAEGQGIIARGQASHVEGFRTKAYGNYSHAEGQGFSDSSGAYGTASHAEGYNTIATGDYSHAQNYQTIATRRAQTALGRYNEEDPDSSDAYGEYAVIVGNGTADDARSNALTVDWNGNVDIASGAKYKIGGVALSASDIGLIASYSSSNHVLSFGNLRIYGHYATVPNTGRVSLTFPSGTFSQVLWAIPYCAQGGFGGYDTTSVTELTTSKVTLYQFNSAGANMNVGVIVIGLA